MSKKIVNVKQNVFRNGQWLPWIPLGEREVIRELTNKRALIKVPGGLTVIDLKDCDDGKVITK